MAYRIIRNDDDWIINLILSLVGSLTFGIAIGDSVGEATCWTISCFCFVTLWFGKK